MSTAEGKRAALPMTRTCYNEAVDNRLGSHKTMNERTEVVFVKRSFAILQVMIICLPLLMMGCTATNTTGPSTTSPTSNVIMLKAVDLMANMTSNAWAQTPVVPDSNIIKSINRFSAGLLQSSVKNAGNVMISPTSVFLALAMTMNGADGETRAAMLKTLADQGITADMINTASRNLMLLLAKSGSKTTLSIANSIWFDQSFNADKIFLQTNADFFKASASKLNFADPQAKDVINAWVKKETHDLIEKIVEKIDKGTVMFLINTVYFISDWKTQFEKKQTCKMTFNAPSGAIETDFMRRIEKMIYFTGNGASGIALPYDDPQFAYFALLPDNQASPRDWLARQDQATMIESILNQMRQKANTTVELFLPKYKASYEDSLVDDLTTLGMGITFAGSKADFSLLSQDREKGLYITDIKHKTFIRVDEKGTEAAAATSVVIGKSVILTADVTLTFDRPFIYGIMDMKTGTPLFIGIMEKPQP